MFSAIAGAQLVNFGVAETNEYGLSISVSVPEGRAYTVTNYEVYSTKDVTLYFLVDRDDNFHGVSVWVEWFDYSLDGQRTVTFCPQSKGIEYHYYPNGGKSVTEINSLRLSNLSEGVHNIVVYARSPRIYAKVGTLYRVYHITTVVEPLNAISNMKLFTIDTESPKISVLSLKNKAYYTSNVPLSFTINEPVSSVKYSLDGSERALNATTGNTTLTGLSVGTHELCVYATDKVGHTGASETITFMITKPEPFPTTLIAAASIVSVVVVCVSLLVYFKKRKH